MIYILCFTDGIGMNDESVFIINYGLGIIACMGAMNAPHQCTLRICLIYCSFYFIFVQFSFCFKFSQNPLDSFPKLLLIYKFFLHFYQRSIFFFFFIYTVAFLKQFLYTGIYIL